MGAPELPLREFSLEGPLLLALGAVSREPSIRAALSLALELLFLVLGLLFGAAWAWTSNSQDSALITWKHIGECLADPSTSYMSGRQPYGAGGESHARDAE